VDVIADGIFERPELFYLKLEPEAGEAAVVLSPQPVGVQLEDSDRECGGAGAGAGMA